MRSPTPWLAGVLFTALATLPACSKDSAGGPAPVVDSGGGEGGTLAYDFKDLEAYLFAGAWKTEGAVVMRDGKVIYEKYAAGFDATKRHITYSVSKSFGSALVGIAVADGVLKLEDIIPSKKMIVVRVGNDRDPAFERDPMIKAAIAAVDAATAGGGK